MSLNKTKKGGVIPVILECKTYKAYGCMLGTCLHCKHCNECAEDTKTFRNTKINDWGNGKREIIIYKQDFEYLLSKVHDSNNLERNFLLYNCPERGKLLIPKRDDVRIANLYATLDDSSARAMDSFYGYVFANSWKYFFTLTFDKRKVNDRYDDDEIMDIWGKFRRKLQRLDSNIKILSVRERHEDNALHFHGFIDTSVDFPLTPSGLTHSGVPQFEFVGWDYGRHSIVVLPLSPEDNNAACANYLIQYVTKQDNIGYGKKRFFHTYNLDFKTVTICNSQEVINEVNDLSMGCYKQTDKLTDYRNFNIKRK